MMKAFKGGYANHQWAVVPCGLYCRDHGYLLEKNNLADTRDGNLSNTLLHVTGKRWADLDALIEATEMALFIHDPDGFKAIDWPKSIAKARKVRERHLLWDVWYDETYPERIGKIHAWSMTQLDNDCKAFDAWLHTRNGNVPIGT